MKAAYKRLDAFHHGTVEGRSSVTALLAEAVALQNSQDLFELYVFDHLLLTRCKARACMMQQLWQTCLARLRLLRCTAAARRRSWGTSSRCGTWWAVL